MSMKHTDGPWSVGERGEIANVVRGVDPVDGSPQTVAEVYGYSRAEQVANAARIVACVNALAGVDDPAPLLRECRALVNLILEAEQGCVITEEMGDYERDITRYAHLLDTKLPED